MKSGGSVSRHEIGNQRNSTVICLNSSRNDLFNARNYFATTAARSSATSSAEQSADQSCKNKLFFFGGYQGTTIRQDPANPAFVPTAAMLAGDFTAFASPACNAGRQIKLRAPFVNNRIDPALYNRGDVHVNTRKAFRKATINAAWSRIGRTTSENDRQYVGKVDYQRTDKDSISGVCFYTRISGRFHSVTRQQVLEHRSAWRR